MRFIIYNNRNNEFEGKKTAIEFNFFYKSGIITEVTLTPKVAHFNFMLKIFFDVAEENFRMGNNVTQLKSR